MDFILLCVHYGSLWKLSDTLLIYRKNGVNPSKWRVDGIAPLEILSGITPENPTDMMCQQLQFYDNAVWLQWIKISNTQSGILQITSWISFNLTP